MPRVVNGNKLLLCYKSCYFYAGIVMAVMADGGIQLVGFGNQRGVFQFVHEELVSRSQFRIFRTIQL